MPTSPLSGTSKTAGSPRILFVDVLRLLALAQMVNGHTLHALLREDVRHGELYDGYLWFRGLVSVAFMLVAGLAFQITTLARFEEHKQSPAAQRRRVMRAFEIIAIGFLLRMPLLAVLRFDTDGIRRGLLGLARIDVLPCIGVSLLLLEALTRICKRPSQVVAACLLLSVLAALLSPWGATLPATGGVALLTGWLGPQGGSAFPLLPFSGYVFVGVVLGAIALPEGGRTSSVRAAARLLLAAAALGLMGWLAARAPWSLARVPGLNVLGPSFFVQKLAVVTMALSLLAFALARVRDLPSALRILTAETLAIYVFHLFVLYGFPFALHTRLGTNLPLTAALSVSAGMLAASCAVGLAWHALKTLQPTRRFVPSSRLTVLAACALLATACLAARAEARPRGSAVRSIALTVADLAEAQRFFVSALGFTAVGAATRLTGAEFAGLTGIESAEAQSQRLVLGQEQIELLAFSSPLGRPAPVDSHSDDLWFQHLALVASDIDRAQKRVKQWRALPISSGVQTIPRDNPAAGGIRAFYFHGPAQHPLELIWFPLGKGMPRWQSKAAPLLGIDHTAIAVADSERSRAFYEDLLGLHVAGHSLNFGREQVALSGVPEARVAITGLRGTEGPGVEFLEYLAPHRGRSAPSDGRANDLWHWETTIAVPDLDQTVARLKSAKTRFVSDGVHTLNGTRAVVVLDPDMHAVRLVN